MVDKNELTRSRGILSKSDREYLVGVADIEAKSQRERNARARIRERIRNGLVDFTTLTQSLETRDRRMIAEEGAEGYDDEHKTFSHSENQIFSGLVSMLTFGYMLSRDIGVDFEIPLELAIRHAETGFGSFNEPDQPFVREVTVTFDVERNLMPDLDQVMSRFERGEELSNEEVGALVRSGRLEAEDLPNLAE